MQQLDESGLIEAANRVDPEEAGRLARGCLREEGEWTVHAWHERGRKPFKSAEELREWLRALRLTRDLR